jgi:hypothetical protein
MRFARSRWPAGVNAAIADGSVCLNGDTAVMSTRQALGTA